MSIKKTLAGIVLAAASLMNLGCDEKTKIEYRDVERWQTPVAEMGVASDDGSYAALRMQDKTDIEAMIFDSADGNLDNISKDSNYSDYPVSFSGNHLIVNSEGPSGNNSKLKVFNVPGRNTVFASDEFRYVFNICPYANGQKVLFQGDKGGSDWHVYMNTIGNNLAQKLLPNAVSSRIESASKDFSVVFVQAYTEPGTGNTLYFLDTTNDALSPLINDSNNYVRLISDNNKKALVHFWNSNPGLKVIDMSSAPVVYVASMPSGKQFGDTRLISENGLGALASLFDINNGDYEFWHMGTQNPPQFKFIAKRDPAAGEYIEDEAISPDGKVVAFGHSASTFKARLYNAETDEFYDPLSGIANLQWSNFMGFSQNGKPVIEYEVSPSVNNNFVVHDPATKTNTQLGQAGYEDFWRRVFTPDNKYFVISAENSATNWRAVILEDLVNSTKKIVEQTGINFDYSGATPDSSHIFLQGRDSTSSNLFMYDVQADVLTNLTNHADLNVNWFNIRAFSKDKSKMYFEERFNNGTKQVKEYTFATGAIRLISY